MVIKTFVRIIFGPTVLPDIHADGVRRGDVGVGRLHSCTSIPHVEEEENGDRREAEDGQEGQGQDVGQEHELRRGQWRGGWNKR